MFTLVAEVENGGYAMLVILAKPELGRVMQYDPVPVPLEPSLLALGPCRSLDIAYIQPEDEERLMELGRIGDGEGIAKLVRTGKLHDYVTTHKLVYRKLSSTVQ